MPLDTMKLPDRAGVSFPWWKWVLFIFSMLPNLPALLNSTPAKADKRVEDVSTSTYHLEDNIFI